MEKAVQERASHLGKTVGVNKVVYSSVSRMYKEQFREQMIKVFEQITPEEIETLWNIQPYY